MESGAALVDRETLYEEVWSEPVTVVALRHGLSDVGLAKICRKLAIPLPSRGYWTKVKAGRIMKRVPLPKLAQPLAAGAPVLEKLPDVELEALKTAKKAAAQVRRETCERVDTGAPVPEHLLVKAARKRLSRRDNWPADTLLPLPANDGISVSVTRESVERALQVVNALLNALLAQGIACEVDSARGVTLLVWRETGTVRK